MRIRITLTRAAFGAALIMALTISTASANRLSISHGEAIRVNFAQLKFTALGTTQAECDLTLEASFHTTTISKVERSLIGYVARAIFGTCTTGSVRILTESLPWHIQYGGFNGTLPTPRPKIRLLLVKFVTSSIFGNCLYTSSDTSPFIFIVEPEYERNGNGIARRLTVEPNNTIPTTCGINSTFEGAGSIFEGGGVQNVLLRLI